MKKSIKLKFPLVHEGSRTAKAQQLSWRWNVGVLWPEAGDEEEHSQGPPARHLQEGEALMLLSAMQSLLCP